MKIALVHELLTMRGGAEKVLRVLADMFPEAPIYTLLYDETKFGNRFPTSRIRTSSLQRFARLSTNHHFYLSRFPGAVDAWDFSEFDLVISSSSAFVHGIITNSAPRHLCYVHSPARYLWDRTHDVLDRAGRGPLGFLRKRYLERVFHDLRVWDSEAADRPDILLAASHFVRRRMELYWRRDSEVLHPPVDDFWFSQKATRRVSADAPYLIVSTLAPYKRIDLAIRACNALGRPLVIAGEGPDRKRLERMAGPAVTFVGYAKENQLLDLYATARATLFPGDEDFGLVPVESLACGTPVIAFRAGGALETLTDDTAEFFDDPSPESLLDAIRRCENRSFDASLLREEAKRFDRESFEAGIRKALQKMLANSRS